MGRAHHRAAGIVGLAVMGSRILGLVREQVFAAMFGAGKLLDAFLAAFQIPNLLRDLLAEGALSTAFTTIFTKTFEKDGEQPAWKLTSLLLATVVTLLGGGVVIGIIFSPLLVQLTSYGFHSVPGKFELTVELTRMLFPFILFVSLASVVMGVLNARSVFGIPASASTAFNFVSIISGVLLAYWLDPQADWRHPHFTARGLYGVSLGVLLGGVAQLAIQLPSLWRLGYKFRWQLDFHDEKLRAVGRLMLPSVIAGAAVQINVMVNGMFASEIDGARSWLNCAFRLMQFPIGVFGVAVATVTLPAVARHHIRNDLASFGRTLDDSLRLVLFLTLPAAVGLFALAPDIIGLIYQHGQFTAADTAFTAAALRAYAIGLAGYAAIKVMVPCFYALNKPNLPLRISLTAIGFNIALNFFMIKVLKLGHVGLATTTSLLAIINFGQYFFHLRRLVPMDSWKIWWRTMWTISVAALGCGALAWLAAHSLPHLFPFMKVRFAALLAGLMAGCLGYGLICLGLRIPETQFALEFLRRKLKR